MTKNQQFETLVAICMRQTVIRDCLRGIKNQSPAREQEMTRALNDLEGAYKAINAIETED